MNILVIVLLAVFSGVRGQQIRRDIHRLMYTDFPGASPCFRRSNGTAYFGCSTPKSGSFGVVHIIENETDVDQFVKGALNGHLIGPYMVVMPLKYMRPDVVSRLVDTNRLSGILLHQVGDDSFPYSPDDTCPNRGFAQCDDKNPWNPFGSGFLRYNFPVPVFIEQEQSHIELLKSCYKNFNLPTDSNLSNRPLCSLRMKSHMYVAVDSPTCLRRIYYNMASATRFCDPLGDENIIFPIILPSVVTKPGYIVLAARLDSASLFDGLAPGAMSSISGLTTLLVTAEILRSLAPVYESGPQFKRVIIMLLNGESFDFIGSQRVVYDMERGDFVTKNLQIKLDDISIFIDVSQIGPNSELFIRSTGDKIATQFADDLVFRSNKFPNLKIKNSTSQVVPPVSVSTFLKARPDLPAIVVTNYDSNFTNKYYNGVADDYTNLEFNYANGTAPPQKSVQTTISSLAASLASTIVAAVNNDSATRNYDIKLDRFTKTADELLECYLKTRSCSLLKIVYPTLANNQKMPLVLSTYVGVDHSINQATQATEFLLVYLGSPRRTNTSKEDCVNHCTGDENLKCIWIHDECIVTSIILTPAVSPAFEIEDYDWASGNYSTWTESTWEDISMTMFLKPSRDQEMFTLLLGLGIMFASFGIVYGLNKKSSTLFAPALIPEDC